MAPAGVERLARVASAADAAEDRKTRARAALAIAKPVNGAVYALVSGVPQQKIVCEVIGNPGESRLWWFADGVPVGETKGLAPIALDLGAGEHSVVCSTAAGETAETSFTVKSDFDEPRASRLHGREK